MLHQTRGIVLKTTDYSESSVVAQIYTEKFGVQSYLVQGVKKPRAKIRLNMLQPLHLLDMVVYHKQQGNLQRIAEARLHPVLQRIPYEIERSAMALFLNEMLYKSIRIQSVDEMLFEFAFQAINWLDSTDVVPVNFHLYFLFQLSKYLGFYPAARQEGQAYFDLRDGIFKTTDPGHIFVLHEPHTSQWASLLNTNWTALSTLNIKNEDRRVLLNKMVAYYRLHVDSFGEINSHKVLEEVLG